MKPEVFDFIDKHNLHDAIRGKVSLSFVEVMVILEFCVSL